MTTKAHFQSPKDIDDRTTFETLKVPTMTIGQKTGEPTSGRMLEFHLTLVKSGDCLEKVEGSNVPHLRAADDLEAVGMKDAD